MIRRGRLIAASALLVSGCAPQSGGEAVEVARYAPGESWFACVMDDGDWAQTITADDVPTASLVIYESYAELEVLGAPAEEEGARLADAIESVGRAEPLEDNSVRIRFANPDACEMFEEAPSAPVFQDYTLMAFGDSSDEWTCEELDGAYTDARLAGAWLSRHALLEKRAEQGCDMWDVSFDVSEMTDQTSVHLTTASVPVLDQYLQHQSADLILRCHENITAALINVGEHLGTDLNGRSRDGKFMMYRIGEHEASSAYWTTSTSSGSVGLWSGGQSIPFIRSLIDEDRILVRITLPSGIRRELTFFLSGLDNHINELADACGWSAGLDSEP
jgi:type VI secretion system protein VasI